MDCNEIRPLIDADADGELDLIRHLELARHLSSCPDCADWAEAARARRVALRESLPRFTVPPELAAKIRRSLPSARPDAGPDVRSWPLPVSFSPVFRMAALFIAVLFVGYQWGRVRRENDLLLGDAVSSHVRSLQASHLTDVTSTDQHTVKPWFAGRLDFSPPVVDLAADGFPLTGGRLEYLDGRRTAALVFRRRQHAINLFIWPAGSSAISAGSREMSGYHVDAWSRGGMNFVAVSEIPGSELEEFAADFQQRSR